MSKIVKLKKQWFSVIVVCVLVVSLLASGLVSACTPKPAAKAEKPMITLVGTSMGGTFTAYMIAASSLLRKYSQLADYSVRTGPGSETNYLNLNEEKDSHRTIAMGSTTAHLMLYKEAASPEKTNVRILLGGHPMAAIFGVPKDSPWNFITDIPKGTRGATPRWGATSAEQVDLTLKALGLETLEQRWSVRMGGSDMNVSDYLAKTADFVLKAGEPQQPTWVQLEASPRGLKLIGLRVEEQQKVSPELAKYGFHPITYLKKDWADTRWMVNDIYTTAYAATVVTHKDFPEDIAYEFTKILFEHHDEFVNSLVWAKYATPENTIEMSKGLPLHPGAIKYLKEKSLLK